MLTDFHIETSWPHIANSHSITTSHPTSGVFRASTSSYIIMRKLLKSICRLCGQRENLKTQSIKSQKQIRPHFSVYFYLFKPYDCQANVVICGTV